MWAQRMQSEQVTCITTMGVESAGSEGDVSPSRETSGGRLPREEDISASLS